MPDLGTSLHLRMLDTYRRKNSFPRRAARAVKALVTWNRVYGLEWGDPETVEPLVFVKKRYVLPYVDPNHVAVEIGVGGGRWTRYLTGFARLYAVDFHQEALDELRKSVRQPNVLPIKNNGTDFPSIEKQSVDYLFSFGTFVHMDLPLIDLYLGNMKDILKPGANVVIHYSDKNKIMARENESFSDNTPDIMRGLVEKHGFKILDEDLTAMWHSAIVRFTM